MSTVTENLPLLRRDISRKQLTHRYRAAMVRQFQWMFSAFDLVFEALILGSDILSK
jgi:hypothetical protein